MVYLTVAYPFYFANCSCKTEGARLCVVEVDTNQMAPWRFYPDEDFIAQVLMRTKKIPLDEAHPTARNRLSRFKQYWKDSIKGLGNAAYQGIIFPKAITRICLFDGQARPNLWLAFADPTITLMNYAICGPRYRGMVEWMFGRREQLPQVKGPTCDFPAPMKPLDDEMTKHTQGFIEHWTKESVDRIGIEVLERIPSKLGQDDKWQQLK
jgi:hypothetical protein